MLSIYVLIKPFSFFFKSAYGDVFKAKWKATGFVLAIKIMKDLKNGENIKKEIDILREHTQHPNIVGYYGCCFQESTLWVSAFLSSFSLFCLSVSIVSLSFFYLFIEILDKKRPILIKMKTPKICYLCLVRLDI